MLPPPIDPIIKELEEEAKKIKAKISKTISDTLVNDLTDDDVELEGYDKSKYNINDLTLDKSKANQGILKLSYKLVSQKNPDKRIERTLEVSGFKIPTTPPAPSSKVLLEKDGESDAKMEAGWTLDSSLTIDKLNKEPKIEDQQWFTKFSDKNNVKSFFMNTYQGQSTLYGKSPSNKPWEGPKLMDFTGVIPSNLSYTSYTNHLEPLYKKGNKVKSSGFLEFKEENGKYVIRFRLFDFKNKKVSKMVYKLVFEK
ncbi:variable surface lipoprotein [Metamycoplasma faucium]|uniref:Variable surface lipoprotein n=1 Tax=Metamycoplasma faucium TaxID=56142 RepID=A0ABZ2TL71_9BACT